MIMIITVQPANRINTLNAVQFTSLAQIR